MDTFIKILEKFSTRPLFFIFCGFSTCLIFQEKSALQEPSPVNIAMLLSAMVFILFIFWGLEWLIYQFNVSLQSNDRGDIGPVIGTAALAVYLVFTFHYLSLSPNALNLTLLTKSGFIYTTNLLLFSLEMFKLSRFR
ncbi:hypothetical protein [Pectobacterium versatile]|uniref:hypothetical protein n=1 Tax=Pectobacterium versatile TaxID=2488639 RepID=UPI000CD259B9|nr:hypothetical protein [Pectobacterium versatile]POE18515.1 hypothetical protein BV923_21045 [Pectobacterium odoriferum]